MDQIDGVVGDGVVLVQNVSPKWNGKTGKVVRWMHDSWYLVLVHNTELVLDLSRGEFVVFRKEDQNDQRKEVIQCQKLKSSKRST